MSDDNIMSQVDYEELVKLLEEEQNPKPKPKGRVFKENRWVKKFIRDFNIEAGTFKVPTYVIYYHFFIWTKETWAKRCSKIEFFRTFNKHFEQKRNGNQRFYMINESLELSEEIYEKAEKYKEKRQRKGKV